MPPNITTTNVDRGNVALADEVFRDDTLAFAGTDTFVKGTLLARQLVNLTPTAGAVAGGTGTGTVTVLSIPNSTVIPKVGVWVLRCVEAVANGGIFRLEDPNGMIVATDLRMTVGSGGATVVEVAGMQFTLTDATDFIVGNTFDITVAAVNKLVPFNPAGAGGAQFPCAVLTYDVSRTGAGDVPIRALVGGKVNKNRLLIDVDGNGNNITVLHIDQLRGYGIHAVDVSQLSKIDNQ
jgi:hypothetical protein